MKDIKCVQLTMFINGKPLWVISDMYGHTILQVVSVEEPISIINLIGSI